MAKAKIHFKRVMLHGNKKAICPTNVTSKQVTEIPGSVTCLNCLALMKGHQRGSLHRHGFDQTNADNRNAPSSAGSAGGA